MTNRNAAIVLALVVATAIIAVFFAYRLGASDTAGCFINAMGFEEGAQYSAACDRLDLFTGYDFREA